MTFFEIKTEPLNLSLKRTFTISRGSRDVVNNVLVYVEAEGVKGIGEAAPNHRYNETQDSATEFILKFGDYETKHPYDIEKLVTAMNTTGKGEYAARAGIEMAVFDWIGKKLHLPLYKLLQAPGRIGPKTTFTLGIDKPDAMIEKVEEADPYPLLKVKLRTDDDKDIILAIRELTNKPLLIDANEGWTTIDKARDMIRFLARHNVYIVEQPMPVECREEMRKLRLKSPVTLFADESCTEKASLQELASQFHGINIKLMKTGAISTSLKMIHRARKLGLQIMVGCMVESTVADTASALVALWADHADVDGHRLVTNNPCRGLEMLSSGHIRVRDDPGLGLV